MESQKQIKVKSAGYSSENTYEISVDGEVIPIKDRTNNNNYNRGINLVILSPSGQITWAGAFDTWESAFESELLQEKLDTAPNGSVAAAAIKDEGTAQLGLKARRSFEQFGSKKIMNLISRGAWAFIGRKSGQGELLDEEMSNGPMVVAKAHVNFSKSSSPSDSNPNTTTTNNNANTKSEAPKQTLEKKVMVEFEGTNKLLKLDVSDENVEHFRDDICSKMNIDSSIKMEYWSPEFNAYVDLEDLSDLRENKAPKLRITKKQS